MAVETGTASGYKTISVGERRFRTTDVRTAFGDDFDRLPVVLRLLAENT
ncbi:MAG: aconitate hydratase, partial [Arthrobacter sp.]|nr:aconitate hydratase [Arthrobacter sp.]